MITEQLLNIIFGLYKLILGALPQVGGTIPTAFLDTLRNTIQASSYFLPMTALLPILVISSGLEAFNLVWKLVLRVKSFIPTMGA